MTTFELSSGDFEPASNPAALQHELGSIDSSLQEALHYMRATADLGRTMVHQATRLVPDIMQVHEDEQTVAEAQRQERLARDTEVNEAVRAFGAAITEGKGFKATAPNPRRSYEELSVAAGSMEEAKLLESQLWWLKFTFWGQASYLRSWDHSNLSKSLPFLAIGQRLNPQRPSSGTDSQLDLLMYPLAEGLPMVQMEVSSRLYDLAEEVGMAHLHRPITSVEEVRRYEATSGARVANHVKRINYRGGSSFPIPLTNEPRKEKKQPNYWQWQRQVVEESGIEGEMRGVAHQLNRQTFEDFNVPFHALKLATMLGIEDAYRRTIGQL